MQTLQNCAVIHEPVKLDRRDLAFETKMHCHRAYHSTHSTHECRERKNYYFFFLFFSSNLLDCRTFTIIHSNISSIHICVCVFFFHFRSSAAFAFSFHFHRSTLLCADFGRLFFVGIFLINKLEIFFLFISKNQRQRPIQQTI